MQSILKLALPCGIPAATRARGLCQRALLLLGLGLAAITVPGHAAERIALVKGVNGVATLERSGVRSALEPGAELLLGDVVETAADAQVGLTFEDNTLVSLGPTTRYTVDRFVFDPTTHAGRFESRLQRGSLAMISGKLAKQNPDAVSVSTPTSVLGVRGTEFVVEVAPR